MKLLNREKNTLSVESEVHLKGCVQLLGSHQSRFFILILFFLLAWVSFVFSPFTGDVMVFFAGARQADYLDGNWLINAFRSWELKGVLQRSFFSFMYKIFSSYSTPCSFSFAVSAKAFYSVLTFLIIYFSVFYGLGKARRKTVWELTLLICAALFAAMPGCHMQAEMSIIVILTSAFFIYVNACRTNNFFTIKLLLAGGLVGTVFFFKSFLILMAIPWAAMLMLYNTEADILCIIKHVLTAALGALVLLCIGLVVTHMINPLEIYEMLNSAAYQTSLFNIYADRNPVVILKKFVLNSFWMPMAIPGVMVGVVIAFSRSIDDIVKRNLRNLLGRLVLWGVALAIICIANLYSIYHYEILLLGFIVEVTLLLGQNENQEVPYCNKKFWGAVVIMSVLTLATIFVWEARAQKLFSAIIFAIPCGWLLIESFRRFYSGNTQLMLAVPLIFTAAALNYTGLFSIFSKNNFIYNRNMNLLYTANSEIKAAIHPDETIMYLDDGTGAFVLGNRSYLKEYYPLPLQRLSTKKEYEKLKCYQEARQKALAFSGKYITVFESWFFANHKNLELKNKILNEYDLVYQLNAYSIPFSLFYNDIDLGNRKIQIYKRK